MSLKPWACLTMYSGFVLWIASLWDPSLMKSSALLVLVLLPLFTISALGATFPRFTAPVIYPTQGNTNLSAAADLNGDGKTDIVITNKTENTFVIMLGNGDGTFTTGQTYTLPSGSWPAGLVIDDFNRDGKKDVVIAMGRNGLLPQDLLVFKGNGDGTFQSAVLSDTTVSPTCIVSADFNRDGNPDLFVCGNGDSILMLGNGDGTFTALQPLKTSAGVSGAMGAVVGDFNGDGIPDVAVNNLTDDVGVLLGNGDGTFRTVETYSTAYRYGTAIAIADMNRDGKPDLVATYSDSNALLVLTGKGDGTFQPGPFFYAGKSPSRVIAGDFDQDGLPDIAVADYGSNEIYLMMGSTGDGFTYFAHEPVSTPLTDIVAADLNGDQGSDLVATGGNMYVLLNEMGLRMSLTPSPSAPRSGQPLTLTATLSPGVPATGTPTGAVGFYDGNTLLGKAIVNQQIATLSVSSLSNGTHRITGIYWGDSNFGHAKAQSTLLVGTSVAIYGDQTIAGNKTFSGNTTFNGSTVLAGSTTFSGSTSFSSSTFNGTNTFSGPTSMTDTTMSGRLTVQTATNYNVWATPLANVDSFVVTPNADNQSSIAFGVTNAANSAWAGSINKSGAALFKSINQTRYADMYAGADASVKINACIADVIAAGGGNCDATGLTGSQTLSQQINIGNGSQQVALLLPQSGRWNITINNASASAFKLYDGSAMLGSAAGNNSLRIMPANGSVFASVVTNNQASIMSMKIQGFMIYNPNLYGTIGNAMVDLSNLEINSLIRDVNIATFKTKGLWIHDTNSGVLVENVWISGDHSTGARPCVLETRATSLQSIVFIGGSCEHPASGNYDLEINGHGSISLSNIYFKGTHFEGNILDTTTPIVRVIDARTVQFEGDLISSQSPGSKQYAIQIAQSAPNLTHGVVLQSVQAGNGKAVDDTINSNQIQKTFIGLYAFSNSAIDHDWVQLNGVEFNSQLATKFPRGITTGTAGSTNKAVCWKDATHIGYCSTVVAANGSCTCN